MGSKAFLDESGSGETSEQQYLEALFEKDRRNYSGKFVQGFVHNANGPLQNLTMLAEMLLSGLEAQDRIFKSNSGENEEWSALIEKQRRRLTQIRRQIHNLAADLQEFMQLYEIDQHGTEIDINALVTRIVKLFHADLFFKHHVKCELRLANNLPHIKAPGKDMVPALFHLFENGVKALRTSVKKELIVETSMHGQEITVKVTDSGCGLPEGVIPDVFFDLFVSKWQAAEKNTASCDPHLGFGLYAARRLLLPHGFEVSLEKSAEGTTALMRMPIKKSRQKSPSPGKCCRQNGD
ncbi:MAG: sensor histidine kinase [Syntrophobacteraceae bacterium]